ncbi:hypothetical protein OTUT144_1733 [Orientia tsutsugamushi str. UT144]|uniref:Uncharacterized protein n=1 Tax=Orientia tsutsugamushi str. UT144 TaxID=1441384 RepID=A0A0F3RJE9_ORITS|nr:hypothetical protein OTUT144_1733 [Orientia tsutsugamushi str. UT144]
MYATFIEKHIKEGKERASLLQNAVESIDEMYFITHIMQVIILY